MAVSFFSEETSFDLKKKKSVTAWIGQVAALSGKSLSQINIIFTSDPHLLKINQEYLNHDTYTDIITFDYTEKEQLEGDIFISIDRVRENALNLQVEFEHELNRVIIHGVLHLMGWKDKTAEQKTRMRAKENECLNLLSVPRGTPGKNEI